MPDYRPLTNREHHWVGEINLGPKDLCGTHYYPKLINTSNPSQVKIKCERETKHSLRYALVWFITAPVTSASDTLFGQS